VQVLTDVHERAWYDTNREKIFWKGWRGVSSSRQDEDGVESPPFAGLDLFQYFFPSAYSGTGDQPGAFYAVYRKVFAEICDLEIQACRSMGRDAKTVKLPSFGCLQNATKKGVDDFYSGWESFSSLQEFEAANVWNLADADNRFVRRRMEEENKKCKARARRVFSEQVRRPGPCPQLFSQHTRPLTNTRHSPLKDRMLTPESRSGIF